MSLTLRPYQLEAFDAARQAIREGARNILICAPTGSGKTVIASQLVDNVRQRGRRANFIVDRISLIQQTSETFDRYGIDHGIIQARHWRFRPSKPVQICSLDTLARRAWPDADLDVFDECHTVKKLAAQRLEMRAGICIGLTATPFTKGLGKLYDRVINVTTTQALIDEGWLVPFRAFACVEPDMAGVKLVAGEFDERETSKRALQVVGDVVQEYLAHGRQRKFICSGVDTAHVVELQRQFVAAGINAATYTYRDGEEDRADTLAEFRKANSSIRGLITVTAASKGFDCPDIGCVIMARPLRKSLAEHIQLLGRGLRISPETGKVDCLVLDHSGNCISSGMRVLTDRGLVAIEKIQLSDKVWDGHQFVHHGGLVNRGVRRVIRYAGLTATPDHPVKTPQGWRAFGRCAEEQTPIVTTGFGGTPVRECEGHITGPSVARAEGAALRACALRVRRLWVSGGHLVEQLAGWAHQGLSRVQPTATLPEVVVCQSRVDAASVLQSERQWVRKLRRAWDHVRVRIAERLRSVDRRELGAPGQREGSRVGPDRDERELRARQPAVGHAIAEQLQSTRYQMGAADAQTQVGAPGSSLRRHDTASVAGGRPLVRANCGEVEFAFEEAEGQVWDLLDCGPRNSFTCEGLLVHNCARFWHEMHAFFSEGCHELDDGKRREKKKAEAKDEPMKCPSCRVIHRPAPFCPACGHEYPKKRAIEHVAGTLVEIMAGGNRKAISAALWDQVASYARRKRGEDGRGLALAIYREITGAWPIGEFANTKTVQVSPEARKLITHANIVFAKRREAAKRREVAAEVQA